MRGRKATWAIIIWTALMAYLVIGGLLNTQVDERYGAFAIIAVGFAVWGLILTWFIGFLILAAIWLVSMPKPDIVIYGPQGQWMVVTAKEAKRRIEREGWSYYPPQPYQAQQPYPGQQPPSGVPPGPPPAGPGRE